MKNIIEVAMFKLTVVIIILILFSGSAASQDIGKKQWIDRMSTALPTNFCKSGQYFRECFRVSQQECEEIALSATQICLIDKADEMPNLLKQPKDGSHWGQKVGECAGNGYEITLIDRRINSDRCNNPENWMP